MAAKCFKHLADRAIIWDGVGNRLDPAESVISIDASSEYSAIIEGRLDVRLLDVIKAVFIVRPYTDQRILDGVAVDIENAPLIEAGFSFAIQTDIRPVFQFRRTLDMERAEYGALGCPRLVRGD